jgi:hypothetical protein
MNRTHKLAALTVLALTLATSSLFADNRRPQTTDGWRAGSNDSRRVTVEGRIRDIDRDRNEFVIRLDRGGYEIIANRDVNGLRRLERGDYARFTGTVSRGRLYVDRITEVRDEDNRGGRDDRNLTGIVQNVDRRAEVLYVDVRGSRGVVAVDVRNTNVRNVRRGDRVRVRGDWQRNGRFEAERVEIDR